MVFVRANDFIRGHRFFDRDDDFDRVGDFVWEKGFFDRIHDFGTGKKECRT